ncbi:TonB-dependent receptor [Coralloluteibacterium stylophorae]|uniref:TonB-dependent receptor n=1 Tax=Coralloluteibacterium stylophorae TaxID=1776034 RepID=A0A8J7VWV7_9GAMM|nr:TonB-dependent receptor [Coralloluteibacterium stylophorae]MBS7457578.1 TonB-dependent receptor [Coralloluteibacterium stylophorae]
MKRTYLSLAVGLALGASASVSAQSADPADPAQAPIAASTASERATTLDAITVTARRRVESAQDVPVAVSAFDPDDLRDLQASNVDGLQGAVPNLNIVQGRGSSNSVNVFIRGIGQPDALQTFDPGVGMYVDDVYYSRINGALFSLFDIQQVEVLRGPQGTLYGKNSTGGAIKITTRDPAQYSEGAVELTVGDHGRLEQRFYGSTPFTDTISASLAAVNTDNDGYVEDPASGREFNEDDTSAARLKLAVRPSDDFSAVFTVDYTRQDNALTLGRPEADLVQTDLLLGPVVLMPAPQGEWDFEAATSFGPDQGQKLTHKGGAATLSWNLGDWTLKSITGYRRLETQSFIDIDASEYELGDVYVGLNQRQVSQELQAQFDNGDTLQAVYGLYYLNEVVPSEQIAFGDDIFAFAGAPVSFRRTIADHLDTESAAAFAHVTWEFVPSWTLSTGLRYTRETKDYDRTTSTFWGAPFTALDETVAFSAEQTWDAWTPSISLQKAFSEQVMAYVSANRGFKSGGFNGRANNAAEVANAEFEPETVWTYEAGVKMRSANNRLQGNATVFRSDYKDFQARVAGETPSEFPVINAAELTIDGVEFEGVALLGEGTRISGQVSYLDASYDAFDDPRTDPSSPFYNAAVSHEHVPFSPEWSARLAVTQNVYLDDGGILTFGADASYRDDTWLSVDNRDVLRQDAYTVYGLFGGWDSPANTWQVRAGVRNLSDEVYKTDGQEFSNVANIQTAYYAWPRNYYASLRYNF